MKKRFLALALACAMCFTLAPAIATATADSPSEWAKGEVLATIATGIIPSNLQSNYAQPIDRAGAMQILINLIEKIAGESIDDIIAAKGVSVNPDAFTDTADPAVLAANALGIVQGVGGNRFDPGGALTRGHIVVIINRAANAMGIDTTGCTHSFVDTKGHWADDDLGWPVHAKIIYGVGNDRFDPNGPLTVEQAIAIAGRALSAFLNPPPAPTPKPIRDPKPSPSPSDPETPDNPGDPNNPEYIDEFDGLSLAEIRDALYSYAAGLGYAVDADWNDDPIDGLPTQSLRFYKDGMEYYLVLFFLQAKYGTLVVFNVYIYSGDELVREYRVHTIQEAKDILSEWA